jgi:hypothetical protein
MPRGDDTQLIQASRSITLHASSVPTIALTMPSFSDPTNVIIHGGNFTDINYVLEKSVVHTCLVATVTLQPLAGYSNPDITHLCETFSILSENISILKSKLIRNEQGTTLGKYSLPPLNQL